VDPDEAADLIPTQIRTLEQLNAFEQTNIVAASRWALRPTRRHKPERILTVEFLVELHRRMFSETWRWAGTFRRSDKNLGVHWPTIRITLHERLQDVQHWMVSQSYTEDEAAVRFHHAVVLVHPFPNGNGRWSRLAADALLHAQQQPPFSWGGRSTLPADAVRMAYLNALRQADGGDFTHLLEFVRS
jgi:Fic-DOC domain mobile mystery protein B